GDPVTGLAFAARDQEQAAAQGRVSGWVREPFPHLEPGSWNKVLAIETWAINDEVWLELESVSRQELANRNIGALKEVCAQLGQTVGSAAVSRHVKDAEEFGVAAP
ncbi:MAG: hypothetical protein L0Y42_16535, partial [Phycisphaerales bacterium]|nr:hypothetical protein [Phycisphaerales bacterium]